MDEDELKEAACAVVDALSTLDHWDRLTVLASAAVLLGLTDLATALISELKDAGTTRNAEPKP